MEQTKKLDAQMYETWQEYHRDRMAKQMGNQMSLEAAKATSKTQEKSISGQVNTTLSDEECCSCVEWHLKRPGVGMLLKMMNSWMPIFEGAIPKKNPDIAYLLQEINQSLAEQQDPAQLSEKWLQYVKPEVIDRQCQIILSQSDISLNGFHHNLHGNQALLRFLDSGSLKGNLPCLENINRILNRYGSSGTKESRSRNLAYDQFQWFRNQGR